MLGTQTAAAITINGDRRSNIAGEKEAAIPGATTADIKWYELAKFREDQGRLCLLLFYRRRCQKNRECGRRQ